MTPMERAKKVVEYRHQDLLVYEVERAIIAAEKAVANAEREACEMIAVDEIGEREFNNSFSREGETVRRIVAKIRARGEEGKP